MEKNNHVKKRFYYMKSLLLPAVVASCMCPRLCFAVKSAYDDGRHCIHEEDLTGTILPEALDNEIHAAFSAALITNNTEAVELVMQKLYKIFAHKVRTS